MPNITKCDTCAFVSCDRDGAPCSSCSDNENYRSHYQKHEVYKNLIKAGLAVDEEENTK